MYKKYNNNNKRQKINNITEEKDKYIEDIETIDGRVIESLPNTHFRVETKDGFKIAYLGGKMRVHKIRILVGDKVVLQLDEYGGKSRIIKRL